jgi:hypothetical protein
MADWFAPFIGFPRLEREHARDELFPLFENRLMNGSRPEYAEYLRRHGLDPAVHDRSDLLARIDGGRATDRVELIGLPVAEDGRAVHVSRFFARGIERAGDGGSAAARCRKGEELFVDPARRAGLTVGLVTAGRELVGFMPEFLVRNACDGVGSEGIGLRVVVDQVNRTTPTVHHRLLRRLEASPDEARALLSQPRLAPIARPDPSAGEA